MILTNPAKLEASICKQSFYDFFLRFWPCISPEPLIVNWHMRVLCDELQSLVSRVIRRQPKEYDLIANVPPGTTKSSITSIALPAWCWIHDPAMKIMCASHGYKLSLDLSDKCRRLILSEKYQTLYPHVKLISEGLEEFKTDKGGERLALTAQSGPIGRHAHLHIFDDLLNSNEAVSEAALKTVRRFQTEVMPSRVVSARLTPFILIMQRLAIGDPTDIAMERSYSGGTNIRFICLPAQLSDHVRPRALRRQYVDGLLDPIRLSRETLKVKRVELGQYAYPGQYDQVPVNPSGGMFQASKIKIIDHTDSINWPHVVRFYDKAGTDNGGCFTVGVKMGKRKNGQFWEYCIFDIVRGQWEAAERERVIRQTAQADGRKVHVWVEEEGGSGGKESAQATVRNLAGFIVKRDKVCRNKVARADAFATQVNDGNVSMVRAPWNSEYLKELALFWFGKYKDQVDASSGAFNALVQRKVVGAFGQTREAQQSRSRQSVEAQAMAYAGGMR